jgi:hypothetical protein
MLVADILKTLVDKQRNKQQNKPHQSFGSFDFTFSETDKKIFKGEKTDDGYINLSVAGNLPSMQSIIATKIGTNTIGYVLGTTSFLGETTPKEFGHKTSEMKSFIVLSSSAVLGNLLGSFVFDDLFGIDLGKINVAIPYFAENESWTDFQNRAKKYALDSVSTALTEENIKQAQNVWEKTQSATITYASISALESICNAIHGYKRHNGSVYWALGWLVFGNLGYAISQGYGKPEQAECYQQNSIHKNPTNKKRSE